MGTCSSSPAASKGAQEKISVCRPSETPDELFNGGTPLKKTYRDFFWFLSVMAMSPEGAKFRTKRKGKSDCIKATVNDVSNSVNEKEGLSGAKIRSYENYCDDPVWRATLKKYLATQGVILTFDYEPRNVVESCAHERLGLFKNGYKFTVNFGKKADNPVSGFSIGSTQYQSTAPSESQYYGSQ